MTDTDSYRTMLAAVQSFHDKHDFRNTSGAEIAYQVALMTSQHGLLGQNAKAGQA